LSAFVSGPEEKKDLAEKVFRLIQIRWATASVEKTGVSYK